MSFARSAFGAIRSARVAVGGPRAQLMRQSARRGYSSGQEHGANKASSDMPWLIASIAVTVPSCWYILKTTPKEAHHLHIPHKIEEPEAEVETEEPKEKEPEVEEPTKEEPKAEEEPKEVEEPKKEEEPKEEAETSAAENEEEKPTAKVAEVEAEKETAEDSETQAKTAAKHTRDIAHETVLSHKAEGTPDSTRSTTTVDVNRPGK